MSDRIPVDPTLVSRMAAVSSPAATLVLDVIGVGSGEIFPFYDPRQLARLRGQR